MTYVTYLAVKEYTYELEQLKFYITFTEIFTAREVPKYGAFSDPYFPVFGLNTEKYGPEKTPYLDTFHAVIWLII